MPATITAHEMPANLTAAAMRDWLRDVLVSRTGWTHVKSFSDSSREFAVFTAPGRSGFIYLSRESSSLSVGLADTFNSSSNALGGTRSRNPSFSPGTSTVAWTLVTHSELVFLCGSYGSTKWLGAWFLWPGAAPAWWPGGKPWGEVGGGIGSLGFSDYQPLKPRPSGASTALGGRQLVSGIPFESNTERAGTTGPDIGCVAGTGLAMLDTVVIQAGVEEYLLLEQSGASLCVRSV